ncbi:phosphotransferase family protein [Sandaracinobacteroides saxicola]|uniref:Phosphotransferase family protein n=1 Tax=Sandaracinobacteroides saxicola TaxID=2759707 RepID=A0A7G5IKF9_9SPHN|nr:phosphotransferase family protein [Sandaracinobacteroides saxicola]QMW23851.1 phosphotransferase family protein [Sandaracinobacteroides saxicola]
MHPLETLLATALTRHWQAPVTVTGLKRFHGGAARETFRFDATTPTATQGLVLRRDPASSLIETDRAVEYHVLARAHAAGLPVPEPLLLATDPDSFGAPGFLMREIPGGRAAFVSEKNPYADIADTAGAQLFTALGRLHALSPTAADLAILPDGRPAARLAHWRREIEAHSSRAQPVAQAALRWLAARCPPDPPRPAIVHGDFRSGNFLVDDRGLLAILDWEMAHIGDPHEDLAWCFDPLWAHNDSRVAALLPQDTAIAAWEAASGHRFDPTHWTWWRMFAGLVGLAIWIRSAHEVATFKTVDPVMVYAGLIPYRFHAAQLARMLEEFT